MDHAHTPGPWNITGRHLLGTGVLAPGMELTADGPLMTCWSGGDIGPDRAEANGRLAASAPDLLDALVLAEDVLSRFPYSSELWPNGTHPNSGIEQIRAAIAKATGQEGSEPADGALGRRDRSVHAEPLNPSETNHG